MESLQRAGAGGMSQRGGWLEYLLPSTGGIQQGGVSAHVAAVTSTGLVLDAQLYQSFVVCSQGTGMFVRSTITAD